MGKGARNRAQRSRSDVLQKRWAERMSFLLIKASRKMNIEKAQQERSDAQT